MKILIIDDSGMVRKTIRRFALKFFPDAEYIPAKNGKEGVNKYVEEKMVKNGAPDLVFLDMLMPEMDGIETLEHIKKFDEDAYVVIVTADIQPPVREKALSMGCRQFLNKPFTEEAMEMVAETWQKDKELP